MEVVWRVTRIAGSRAHLHPPPPHALGMQLIPQHRDISYYTATPPPPIPALDARPDKLLAPSHTQYSIQLHQRDHFGNLINCTERANVALSLLSLGRTRVFVSATNESNALGTLLLLFFFSKMKKIKS